MSSKNTDVFNKYNLKSLDNKLKEKNITIEIRAILMLWVIKQALYLFKQTKRNYNETNSEI